MAKRIKKSTLDAAIDWVKTHGYDFWQQFTDYEWKVASIAVDNMRIDRMSYREAVKRAYETVNKKSK